MTSASLHSQALPRLITRATSSIGDPAREAYNDAVKAFNEKLTKDECKRIWLSDKIDIQQVQDAVTVARKSYESKSQQSKARKWLTKFSERIMYYSKIMDMLSQHHPEYVALAWGAMKFLVIVRPSVNIKTGQYRSLNSLVVCHKS